MEKRFNIIQLKRKPDNGLVFEVTFVFNFKLENKEDRHIGMITLTGDPEAEGFVPYEELTEEIVKSWVESELGEEEILKIETDIQKRLQERIDRENNPEFLEGLPWRNNRF